MWPDLTEQVTIERANIEQLFSSYASVIHKAFHGEPDFIERSALSTMLHSFYNGVENIFKRIALEIDGDMPSGSTSHSALLSIMTQPTNNRPAVISEELQNTLSSYLGFRHVFRHTYSFQLNWNKMQDLVLQSEDSWRRVKKELDQFFAELPS